MDILSRSASHIVMGLKMGGIGPRKSLGILAKSRRQKVQLAEALKRKETSASFVRDQVIIFQQKNPFSSGALINPLNMYLSRK